MARIYNFASGPSILPLPALEEAAAKLVDFEGTGMSLIEMSHRGPVFDAIHNETLALLRELLEIPDDFHLLLLQGGATFQFAMIPMAFLREGVTADYILSGHWGVRAWEDAKLCGSVNIAWDGKGDNYMRMPAQSELSFNPGALYAHLCSNETIGGIQWKDYPDAGKVPLVIDMSSDILSRPLPWERTVMMYAGAQKNLAPAGMVLVAVRRDFAERARKDLPAYMRYDLHIKNNSLYNTPSTFATWMANLTLKWVKSIGGMREIERRRDEKAGMLYSMIDKSGGFYRSPVDPASRSTMNVVWRLPEERLEKIFLENAEMNGLSGLPGHRSVGGCRASIYNAMPVEGVRALVDFMKDFMESHG